MLTWYGSITSCLVIEMHPNNCCPGAITIAPGIKSRHYENAAQKSDGLTIASGFWRTNAALLKRSNRKNEIRSARKKLFPTYNIFMILERDPSQVFQVNVRILILFDQLPHAWHGYKEMQMNLLVIYFSRFIMKLRGLRMVVAHIYGRCVLCNRSTTSLCTTWVYDPYR